jgi:hypothetical protein
MSSRWNLAPPNAIVVSWQGSPQSKFRPFTISARLQTLVLLGIFDTNRVLPSKALPD